MTSTSGAGGAQFARHGQAGEAGAADEDVAVAIQRLPLVAALGGTRGHRGDERGPAAGRRDATAQNPHRTAILW